MVAATSSAFDSGADLLDRDGDEPLWLQLEGELRRRLSLGHFAERFPTDRELMQVYGVSRHTARHAVDRLGNDGIVRRSRGVGTSVDSTALSTSSGSASTTGPGRPEHASENARFMYSGIRSGESTWKAALASPTPGPYILR